MALGPEALAGSTADVPVAAELTRGSSVVSKRRRNWGLRIAIGWLALLVFGALFADLLPLADPIAIAGKPFGTPGLRFTEPLGFDHAGRSVTSRLVYGSRVSLIVSISAMAIALVIGLLWGTVVGYRRGSLDGVSNVVIDSLLAFPPLVLLIALAFILRPSQLTLIVALSVVLIPSFTRLARANALTVARRDYVTAARATGATHWRVLRRQVIPNVAIPLSAYAFIVVAVAIVAEGSVSFLGLGVPPPTPSWGGMVAESKPYFSLHPVLVFIPCAALLLTVLAFNTIGDWVRSRIDDRSSGLA